MTRYPLLFALTLTAACDKSKQDSAVPEPVAAKPTAALADACVDRVKEWAEIPDKPVPEHDERLAGLNKDCGMLYPQCGGVETAAAFLAGGLRTHVLGLAEQCMQAYCGSFADPKPKLCNGGRAVLTSSDTKAIQDGSLEFHKAMLLADVGGDAAALDPIAERLGDLWVGYGEVDLGGGLDKSAASLGFSVAITPEGFTLQVGKAHKWATVPDATAGDTLKIELLAAGGKRSKKKAKKKAKKKDDKEAKKDAKAKAEPAVELDPARWDYAALAKEAKALKAANPEESSVTLVVAESVPTAVQVQAMDALRGEGCKLEASSRPAEIPKECVFWRQVLR